MLRLKANKTSLYKLVSEYTVLPGMRRVEFRKVLQAPRYFLKWTQDDGFASAYFSTTMNRQLLSITVWDIDGCQVSHVIHYLTVENLRERGMVEEFVTAAERRRIDKKEDNPQ